MDWRASLPRKLLTPDEAVEVIAPGHHVGVAPYLCTPYTEANCGRRRSGRSRPGRIVQPCRHSSAWSHTRLQCGAWRRGPGEGAGFAEWSGPEQSLEWDEAMRRLERPTFYFDHTRNQPTS